jgi:HK97 family phage major capsid protein
MAAQPDFGELDKLRSVEELANLQAATQREVEALDAEYAGLPMPAEVQEAWDAATATHPEIGSRIANLNARKAQLAQMAGDEKKIEAPEVVIRKTHTEADIYNLAAIKLNSRTPQQFNQNVRDNAMRAAEILRVSGDRYDQDKSRERLTNLLDFSDSEDKEIALRVLTTNAPEYRSAFDRYVKSGGLERGSALAVGVDATGGFAVPVAFDPTMIAIGAWTAINPYRASARVVTISGTDTWQALTATAITAAYATEGAAANEQGPTFARPEFIVKRAQAFVTASYEMMQDRSDLAAELGTLFGEAKDNLEENTFTVSAGTGVLPLGIGFKDAITRVDSITNDTVAVADIRAVEAALPIRHRFGAAWYLSRAAIRAIQAFETTGGQLFNGLNYAAVGNPVNSFTGNTGLTLLGYPVFETPSMPWTPTTDDTTWGVLMNPKNCFVIVDRVGLSVRVIPDMLDGATPSMPTGQSGIFAFWRNTARVLNADAGRQGAVQ